jgi:hypothetical protein
MITYPGGLIFYRYINDISTFKAACLQTSQIFQENKI